MNRDGGWHDSVPGIARRTLEAAYEDNIPFLAGGLSFDLLLTTIPFIVVLLAVASYLVHHQITTHQVSLHELLVRFLPTGSDGGESGAFEAVERVLAAMVGRRGRLTVVGLPLFLWFSTRLFGGLRAALNEVFDTDLGLAGAVVTSGTDSLEELAYFLDLTVRSAKPISG